MRRPRVFLSYRHEERRDSERHQAWVHKFAQSLASWNVDVIWDERLRVLFKPYSSASSNALPFLAEVSTLCLQVAQIFMPVVTRGYMERVGVGENQAVHGTVTEEWQRALSERTAGHAEIVAIVREWPIPGLKSPPESIGPENAWDFRFVAPIRDEVELLCDALHGLWAVERPHFDEPFADWISEYLKFCIDAFNLPWPGIERWGCDFNRPAIYLNYRTQLAAFNPVDSEAKRQRDLAEAYSELNIRKASPEELARIAEQPLISPEDEASSQAEAMQLMRNIMTKHVAQRRRPFNFSNDNPADRSPRGLYFGPTLLGFSYLHPDDPHSPK